MIDGKGDAQSNRKLTASVVITTKNRKDELCAALNSVMEQSARPEIIVIDDGSSDGTSDLVRVQFPEVILHRFEDSQGLVVRRNTGARLAGGEVIFSIDDDAIYSTPTIIEQTLADFSHPRLGAVAIPYIDVNKSPRLEQAAPDQENVWLTHVYIGTAHAVRRDIFLQLAGYREALVHQGEESDFCVRMLEAGYFVRLGRSEPIHHFESPKRDFRRMDFYGCRNAILFAWQNVPARYLPIHLLATTFNCLCWSFNPRRLLTRLSGIAAGYSTMLATLRLPVTRSTYQIWRRLKKSGATRLDSFLP